MRAPLAVLMLWALLVTGCGNDGESGAQASGCGPVRRERLDPASARHLLPGAQEPTYLTDPPTSGAHASGRPPTGTLTTPLSRPQQVAILESGGVLIQYRDLSAAERRRLTRLAGERVTVAPSPGLPARVVLTAWTVKQTCTGADDGAVDAFIDRFGGTSHNH